MTLLMRHRDAAIHMIKHRDPNNAVCLAVRHSELSEESQGRSAGTRPFASLRMTECPDTYVVMYKARGLIGMALLAGLLLAGCAREPAPPPTGAGVRVVSLAPSLTEIICAIGAQTCLVGRTSACDYPPDIVRTVPVIGGFGAPALESLLKVKPTLILDVALEDEVLAERLAGLGLRRERITCAGLADVPPAIVTVGLLLRHEAQARPLADRLGREIAELQRTAAGRSPDRTPAVFVEIWGDPLMTAGRKSFVAELVNLAGGKNIGDEVTDREYFSVSSEWVIARNPDVILCLSSAGAQAVGDQKSAVSRIIARRPGWGNIKAVRNGRVYDGLDANVILRPGPRVLEGVAQLRQGLEPLSAESKTPVAVSVP